HTILPYTTLFRSIENQERIRSIFPEMIYDGQLYRDDVAKISFVLEPNSLETAEREFGDKLKVSSWTATGKRREFGEFALLGVDKVNAVHTLLEYLNGDIKDTLAFGDAENDVKMVNGKKLWNWSRHGEC